MKIRKDRADRIINGLPGKRCMFGLSLFLLASLFLGGCGSHNCAICGQDTKKKVTIAGKEFHICENCCKIYIEEEHLFEEDP